MKSTAAKMPGDILISSTSLVRGSGASNGLYQHISLDAYSRVAQVCFSKRGDALQSTLNMNLNILQWYRWHRIKLNSVFISEEDHQSWDGDFQRMYLIFRRSLKCYL